MLDAIKRALDYVVIRSIQIIGEAANKVQTAEPRFAAQHPQVPRAVMYGMRNLVIHDCFEVDLAVAWQTVQPELRNQVLSLLNVIERCR
jgi:uncharacterized protein with HEPN domain